MTVCHSWRPFGSKASPKQVQARVEWSDWIGPLLTIVLILISQSRLEGKLEQQLKIVKEDMDWLEGKVERLEGKVESMSQQVSQLGRQFSYLQGQENARD